MPATSMHAGATHKGVAPAPGTDDAALLVAIAAGDHAAFAALYDRYNGPLNRHAYRLLGEHEAAEDAVQAAFLNVWRRAADFDPARGDAAAWLFISTQHAALDTMRRRTVHARGAVSLDLLAGLTAPDDTPGLAERLERHLFVRSGLATLPSTQREALELAYFAGLTCAAIAALTSVPVGTAKGRLRLAREKLRAVLAPLLDE